MQEVKDLNTGGNCKSLTRETKKDTTKQKDFPKLTDWQN